MIRTSLLSICCLISSPGQAQTGPSRVDSAELPRRPSLGVAIGLAPSGVPVVAVQPKSTAEALRLRVGDIIVEWNGNKVEPSSFGPIVAETSVGEEFHIKWLRDGKLLRAKGRMRVRPLEGYSNASVSYGSVPIAGGLLRDILVQPRGRVEGPVVFLLQGITCASVEAPDPGETYGQLAARFAEVGWGFYRVEKPGVGDSRGGLPCTQRDFDEELQAFQMAYDHLIDVRGVSVDRIVLLGHSMGGLQAPYLAARRPPGGVIVYGTVVRNWADYHLDGGLWQPFLYGGEDPAQSADNDQARRIVDAFFWQQKPPSEIAKLSGISPSYVQQLLGWDGNINAYGRHFRFLQSLSRTTQIEAWKDVTVPVLSLYGGSDLVALSSRDHRLLVDVLNYYRTGSAQFVEVAGADHDMRIAPDPAGFRKFVRENGAPPSGPFNLNVFSAMEAWINKEVLSK